MLALLYSVTLPIWLAAVLAALLVLTGAFIFRNNPLKGARSLDELDSLASTWLAKEKAKFSAKFRR